MIDRNYAPPGMFAVPYTRCADCAYDARDICPVDSTGHLMCGSSNRLDGESAMFAEASSQRWQVERDGDEDRTSTPINWWNVHDGARTFSSFNEADAVWLCALLNGLPEPADGG